MSTWVLLRGLAREGRHWGAFPLVLQQRLGPGARVCLVDLPGNGRRAGARSPTNVDAIVDAVRADLQAMVPSQTYIPVALSLGGMVAMRWAQRMPQEVAGMVLINTSAGGLSPLWERMRPACYPQLLRCLLPGVSELARERAVYALTSNLPMDQRLVENWAEIARSRPVSRANFARQLLAAARFTAPAQMKMRTLVLASAGDRLVSHRCSEAIAQAWGARLRVHRDAGHDLPLDDAQWVVKHIAEWAGTPR